MAGFPCQSFSIAGMQKGFDDIRGTLFFDIARILREKRPRFILLENVKNLVSHDGTKTIVKILNTLTDLEYVVDFTIINSCEAGVPQNRDRTYICGILHGKVEKFLPDVRSEKINKLKKELNKKHFNGFNFFNKVYFNNRQLYIKDILETNVDKSYFLTSNEIKKYLSCIKINDPDITEAKIIKLFNLPKTVHNDLERQRRVYSTKGISPTVLARSDSTKVLIHIDNSVYIRKLTPVENFYVQGFSNDFVNNIKNTY